MERETLKGLWQVGVLVLFASLPIWWAVAAHKHRKSRLIWAIVGLLLSVSTLFICILFVSGTKIGEVIGRNFAYSTLFLGFGFSLSALVTHHVTSRFDHPSAWADGTPTRIFLQLTVAILGLVIAMIWLLSRLAPIPGSVGTMPYSISIIGILGCGAYVLTISQSLVGRLRIDSTKRTQWSRVLPAAILLLVIICTLGGWWEWQDYSRGQALKRELQTAPYVPE